MQNHQQCQKVKHQTERVSLQTTSIANAVAINFTNTAKLPIETVKLLIASVSLRPSLWNRNHNGQKRSDINALWQQVSEEVNLPENICRAKWGHLRDNFRKVFIRNTLSAELPTRWRFYNDMRFMETAVAKNVMRHNKLRARFLHWQQFHNDEQQQQCSSTSATAALNQYCDPFISNHINFSELSAYFQSQQGPNVSKFIKLEKPESEPSLQDSNDVPPLLPESFLHNGNGYEKSENIVNNNGIFVGNGETQNVYNGQFDEDATSAEENYQISIENEKYLFENNTKINVQNCNLFKHDFKDNNACENFYENDSDRMFLLSLLPYLRKVKEQRKLNVRQKLQDVLIQEFS